MLLTIPSQSEVNNRQMTEDRGHGIEESGERADDRLQMTEDIGDRTDDRGQRAEARKRLKAVK